MWYQNETKANGRLSCVHRCSLQDFNVAFGGGDVQSRCLGVRVRCEGAASGQDRHGVLEHDPLLLLSGLIHVYPCDIYCQLDLLQ